MMDWHPNAPGIGSRPTTTLNRMEWGQKVHFYENSKSTGRIMIKKRQEEKNGKIIHTVADRKDGKAW